MRRDDELLELVAAVVDGVEPNWEEVSSRALSEDERRFLAGLQLIAGVSSVHRTHGALAVESTAGDGESLWWGRFELLALIGEGAFGRVYRARDPLLNRTVAVKLLKPELASHDALVARVLSEGQALAALDHPNIVRIYEAAVHDGRAGLCMEYVDGRTLAEQLATDGPLSAHEAALVGQQVCRALAEVHRQRLVHCDIKSRNVMRAQGGRVVLMDFGAGLAQESIVNDQTQLTGTPLYLAPELLEKSPPTPQSDVYAVGVLLFHLVTRSFPVLGSSLAELRLAHRQGERQTLHDLRPDLADSFVHVVNDALASNPADRYPSAGAMLAALTDVLGSREFSGRASKTGKTTNATTSKRIGAAVGVLLVAAVVGALTWAVARTAGAPSDNAVKVAVLPLRNFTGEADWRVDAVTDELMTTLGSLPGVRVTGWTSVSAVTSRPEASVSEIAATLGVDWIIEGSVRRVDSGPAQAAVTLSVLQASSGTPVWTTSVTKGIGELFSVAREVSPAVAAKLGVAGPRPTLPPGLHSNNVDARDAYLEARYLLRNETPANLRQARRHLEKAIALDPGYALAHAALARCIIDLEIQGAVPRPEAETIARGAVERAIALDHTLAEPYTRLGDLELYYDFDWQSAGDAYRRAVNLNPYDITARIQYSKYLAALGRVSDAVQEARLAQDIDPISPALGNLAMMLYYARRYDEALAAFERRRQAEPGLAQVHFSMARVYAAKGAFNDAERELQYAIQLGGATPHVLDLAELARTYAQAGRVEEARQRLAALEQAHPDPAPSVAAYFGYVYAALGEHDRAFALLDSAVQRGAAVLLWAQGDPRLDPLRNDRRVRDLLRLLRLAD